MSREYYHEVLTLKEAQGWDNKEWARHIGVEQRVLEAVDAGTCPENEEARELLLSATRDPKNTDISHLYRFKSPIIIGTSIHKGGIGKTTCSVNIADDLAYRGYNVLFIDGDGQMDATSTLLPGSNSPAKNIFAALFAGTDIREQIVETEYVGLDIVPGSTMMGSAEAVLSYQAPQGIQPEQTFKRILEQLVAENYYDFVFVDMDKTIGALNRTLLTGCTHLLFVSEAAAYSLEGVGVMAQQYQRVHDSTNPDLEILGIVMNKVAARKKIVNATVQTFEEAFPGKLFKQMIRSDANVEKAQWESKTIRAYNQRCNAWNDMQCVTDELLERLRPLAM